MAKKRYETIDGLRVFACLGVVMVHVLANGEYQIKGFFSDKVIPSFSGFLILFMIISGFGMCCGYYEKFISGKTDIVSFYKKRYMKILPFFAFLCLLDLVISPSINSFYEVFANLTLCFGLIPNANITVIGVGWFIGLVFTFYLLFPFYCSLLSNRKKAWATFGVSYIMHIVCRTHFGVDNRSFVYNFVFFVAGGMVFLYRDEISRIKGITWISLVIAVVMILVYYFVAANMIVILLFNSAILIFAMSLDGRNILNNKLTNFIGGISFEIYLCHMVIYRCVEKAHLLRISTNEYLNYSAAVVMIYAGAVAFAFVGQKLLNKAMDIAAGIEKSKN